MKKLEVKNKIFDVIMYRFIENKIIIFWIGKLIIYIL